MVDRYTVTARVADERGAADTKTTDITVRNVGPEAGGLVLDGVPARQPADGSGYAPSTVTIDENGIVTVEGTFTDPGLADMHTVTIA
ncbi:hypothetical protein, partial [Rhodoplanes sp. SY1]|uniref:hypothetical protein n=1 Tax=Rhodoplanes sp. SY1 TaxID=3166646 RepID=UPI0038B579E2